MPETDRAAGAEETEPGRTARNCRPSKAAQILGAAIGTLGAVASMEGLGTARPGAAPTDRTELVRPLPADAAAREPGISAGDLARDMARAMQTITESPQLSRRFAAAMADSRHAGDESMALEQARQDVVAALGRSDAGGSVPAAALYALAGNLLVEFLKAVKNEIMARAVKKAVDGLASGHDEKAAPDGLDSAETRELLRELAAAVRREQDAAAALRSAQDSIAGPAASAVRSAGPPDPEIAAAVRDAGERLIAAAEHWSPRRPG